MADTSAQAPRRSWRRLIPWLCGLYLALLLGLWALLATQADRWWPATVLLFSPRWLWAVPLAILLPAALTAHRRSLWLLAPAALVVVVPVMGFCLHWPTTENGGQRLRLLTCNCDASYLHPDALGRLLEEARPDVVTLQAWPSRQEAAVFGQGDWHRHRDEEFFCASRFPIRQVEPFPDQKSCAKEAVVRYLLETPFGDVNIFNLHLETPRDGLEAVLHGLWHGGSVLQANSDLRHCQSAAIRDWVGLFSGPVILAGDFNTPPDSTIFRACWSSYSNAFSQAGFGWGNTHFTRHTGIRIDHILAGPGWRCLRAWVGPDIGPAHRPVLADLGWK